MAARSKKKTARTSAKKSRAGVATAKAAAVGASTAELRAGLGLTRPVFARLLNVSERTVAEWERDATPKASAERAVKELRSVIAACERVMKPDFVGKWLVTPNDMLGGFKPIERIERGETADVLRVLFFVEAGIPL